MNAEIVQVRKMFMNLYEAQRDYLAKQPPRVVEDLLHEAEDLRHDPSFSVVASAEINRAACLHVLGRLS